MLGVASTLFDPAPERGYLGLREAFVGGRGRHVTGTCSGGDAFVDQTVFWFAGNQRDMSIAVRSGGFKRVETEAGHTLRHILAVALETVFREDGANVATIVDGGSGGLRQAAGNAGEEGQR